MAADTRWYLVCYDIRNARRLRKAAKLVEGYGQRLQYSVFRCYLSDRQLQEMRWRLTELLEPADDVMMIPVCTRCVEGIHITHDSVKECSWPKAPPRHLIL